MIFVIATSRLKPGCREAFIQKVRNNYPAVRAEKGCISYTLTENLPFSPNQISLGPDEMILLECWESQEALKAHLATPHMKAFMEAVKPLRESSELRVLSPL